MFAPAVLDSLITYTTFILYIQQPTLLLNHGLLFVSYFQKQLAMKSTLIMLSLYGRFKWQMQKSRC